MKIIIIGVGYVGLVAGTCFADIGHEVVCIDHDEVKINNLCYGRIPIYEPQLEQLVIKNLKLGNISFSTDKNLINTARVIVIAVGTPADAGGSTDLSYLRAVVADIIHYVTEDKIIIIKSTVPIGTANNIKQILKLKKSKLNFQIISNPEFLREGSAVHDFLHPDRIIIGSEDNSFIAEQLYSKISKDRIIFTDNTTAEVIKYAANSFLAMKIAFINEISDIAEKCDADIEDITKGIGSDNRIGKQFLNPGPGYGGSCFPKDTYALAKMAKNLDVSSTIMDAVIKSNNDRKAKMVNKVITALQYNIEHKTIAIFGLTFKAGTNDMRDSASIDIVNYLLTKGAIIKVYDPEGIDEAKHIFGDKVIYCNNAYDAAKDANAICIITEWKEFIDLDLNHLKHIMQQPIMIDLRNIFSLKVMQKAGFKYISIGRKEINNA